MSTRRRRAVVRALAAAVGGCAIVVIFRVWGILVAIETLATCVVALFGIAYLRSNGWSKVRLILPGSLAAAGRFSNPYLDALPGAAIGGSVSDWISGMFRARGDAQDDGINQIDAVTRAIASLPTGDVIVGAPRQMKVGDTGRVTVAITTADRDQIIAKIAAAGGAPLVDTTKVGNVMRVSLSADKNDFEVVQQGSADRAFGGSESWLFDITAMRAGTKKLGVLVAILLQLPGRPTEQPLYAPVKEIEIRVRVAYLRSAIKHAPTAFWSFSSAAGTYVITYDPVKAFIIKLINYYIGSHLGFQIPTTKG